MSEPDPPPDPPPPARPAVPLLTHRSADGDLYTRRPDVEAEIARLVALDPSRWTAAGLKSETVVHLIRRSWPTGEKTVLGRLLDELAKRTTRIATASARGFSPTITEEIVGAVGLEVIELALTDKITGQSEFLECSFDLAVQRRAFKQAAKRKRSRTTAPPPKTSSPRGSSEPWPRLKSVAPSPPSVTPTTGWRSDCTTYKAGRSPTRT